MRISVSNFYLMGHSEKKSPLYSMRDLGRVLTENLFPRRMSCLFCGRHWHGGKLSAGLCPQCLLQWRRFRQEAAICPFCGSFNGGNPCRGPCAGRRGLWPERVGSLAAIYAAAPYTGLYRQSILSFKYNGQIRLTAPLAHLMTAAWFAGGDLRHQLADGAGSPRQGAGAGQSARAGKNIPMGQKPCLVPIPLHRDKEKARGYNQSRLLAAAVSRETGFPVEELLCRPQAGRVQAGLDKEQRRRALDRVFQWAGASGRPPGPAIIIDDVVTTGATLESCAHILRLRGYSPIWGLSFAGGSGPADSPPPACETYDL